MIEISTEVLHFYWFTVKLQMFPCTNCSTFGFVLILKHIKVYYARYTQLFTTTFYNITS